MCHILPEMLYDNLYLLSDVGLMQINKPCHLAFCSNRIQFRIILNRLIDPAVGFPCCIVIQYIEDITFLDRLFHRIHIVRFLISVRIQRAEKLNRLRFRCCRKCDHRYIRLLSALPNLLDYLIFFGLFLLCILICKDMRYRLHISTIRRGVCFINQNRKTLLFQITEERIV